MSCGPLLTLSTLHGPPFFGLDFQLYGRALKRLWIDYVAGKDLAVLKLDQKEKFALQSSDFQPVYGNSAVHIRQIHLKYTGLKALHLTSYAVAVLHYEHVGLFPGQCRKYKPGSHAHQSQA